MEPGIRPRNHLEDWCRRSDGGPYPAYRDLAGRFRLDGLDLEVLRVQPDPFAGPSRIRLLIPYAHTTLEPAAGALPGGAGAAVLGLLDPPSARAVALRDFLARAVDSFLQEGARSSGLSIGRPGQQVLDRSSVLLRKDHVEIRLECDLPARGRRILGREAARLLLDAPERLLRDCLGALDRTALERHAACVEDFAALQSALRDRGWIGFIGDGSLLARRAGDDDRPLLGDEVVPFESPAALREEVTLPHAGRIAGMALPPGVTLLCGGGFHGKSTLLRALAGGVHPHIPGDGRERAAARVDAAPVRAEDGRAVTGVDLRPFLHDLPFGRDVAAFTTANASGSTSQAAAIIEALQAGSRFLLMDEDTSATNFMIRDGLMEQLLEAHREPITPFLHRARTLYTEWGVSSVLVIGGSGEYFRAADRVILLDTYRPLDRTERAREIARQRPPLPEDAASAPLLRAAIEAERSLPAGAAAGEVPRIKALEARRLLVGGAQIEIPAAEALREGAQGRFLARVLAWRFREQARGPAGTIPRDSAGFVRAVEAEWSRAGLDAFDRETRGDLAAVRTCDLLAAVDRLRGGGRA